MSRILSKMQHDLPSGVVVYLVALPLCLGISLASGVPVLSGILAGAIGGVVVGALSGSPLSVSGPAAGLVTIVAQGILHLGSLERFAAAVMICGFLQVIFGVVRLGKISNYISTSVIKGMMAAIGIVIILKQFPHALGWDPNYEGDEDFVNPVSHENTLTSIGSALSRYSWVASLITLASVSILMLWDHPKVKSKAWAKWIPAPLLVVVAGVVFNEVIALIFPGSELKQSSGHLVSLPVSGGITDLVRSIKPADFSALKDTAVIMTGLTLAIVASLESLLSLEATDNLDPLKRISPPNRELKAQGVGNMLAGILGALPITSVVVRSSANVYAGAKSQASTIIHGVLIVLTLILIPGAFNHVPLASLAAILIMIGYKLSSFTLMKSYLRLGASQYLPFFATIFGVVFTDLLKGIAIGVVSSMFFVLRANQNSAITLVGSDNTYLIRANKDWLFIHKSELKEKLRMIPDDSSLIIDATKSLVVDQDIYDIVASFSEGARLRNIQIECKNFLGKLKGR